MPPAEPESANFFPMKITRVRSLFSRSRVPAVLLAATVVFGTAALHADNPAATPAIRNTWLDQHQKYNAIAAKGNVDLLFMGDSITWGWQTRGKAVWNEYYGQLKAANFGIGGDRTENVLWRLQNGNLDGISPKVVVLLIGTNNTGRDTPGQIVGGVTAVVREINQRSPGSRVLLMGIFPRDERPGTNARNKITEINRQITRLADGKQVFFVDIGAKLLQPDATISRSLMPDFLHPDEAGYRIWAESIAPKLHVLLRP